jgi:hypothetical protein
MGRNLRDSVDGASRIGTAPLPSTKTNQRHEPTPKGRDGRLGSFGNIDRHQEEPLAVLSEHQISLALGVREFLGLVLAHDEGDFDPTLESQQADPIGALEGHHPLVEGHRGVGPKLGPLGLVRLGGLADLGDAPNRHLGREAEAIAQVPDGF